jgi:predicted nucleic acid-binding protein
MIDEALLEFVDTNVLVYAHDKSAGRRHDVAKKLVRRLWESGRGGPSVQVLQEFYVTVTKKTRRPLDPEEARQVLHDLALWRTFTPEAADVLGAIDLARKHDVSFWDAMILRSAGQLGCDIVWSEDLNPEQTYDGVRVVKPFRPSIASD